MLNKVTLKDLDFTKLEQTIKINKETADNVKLVLLQDVLFFKTVKLMDYSLLIMKIDWGKYCRKYILTNDQVLSIYNLIFQI